MRLPWSAALVEAMKVPRSLNIKKYFTFPSLLTLVKQGTGDCRWVCILWSNPFVVPEILNMVIFNFFKSKQKPLSMRNTICHQARLYAHKIELSSVGALTRCRIHRWYQECVSLGAWGVKGLNVFQIHHLGKAKQDRTSLAYSALSWCLNPTRSI